MLMCFTSIDDHIAFIKYVSAFLSYNELFAKELKRDESSCLPIALLARNGASNAAFDSRSTNANLDSTRAKSKCIAACVDNREQSIQTLFCAQAKQSLSLLLIRFDEIQNDHCRIAKRFVHRSHRCHCHPSQSGRNRRTST